MLHSADGIMLGERALVAFHHTSLEISEFISKFGSVVVLLTLGKSFLW